MSNLNSAKHSCEIKNANETIASLKAETADLSQIKEKDQKIEELNGQILKLNSDLEAANKNLDKNQEKIEMLQN